MRTEHHESCYDQFGDDCDGSCLKELWAECPKCDEEYDWVAIEGPPDECEDCGEPLNPSDAGDDGNEAELRHLNRDYT